MFLNFRILMRCSVLLPVFFISNILAAQKNFREAYIVNREGDTISGSIDHKEWKFSPTHILFKSSDENAAAKEYGINELTAFTIIDREAYRRDVVKISLHPSKLNEISGKDTTWKIDTVFLKVIYTGKQASLFSYTDKIKERFYIQKLQGEQPTELIKREYLAENGVSLIKEYTYKDQLKRLSYVNGISNDALVRKIDEMDYEERELEKLMKMINGNEGEAVAKGKKHSAAYWFAGAGLQRQNMFFRGDHQFARNTVGSKSEWMPRISGGVDLFANPNVGKFFFRTELGFQINKSSATAVLDNDVKAIYELSTTTISLQSQFNYTLYNTDKIKIPVGAGIIYSQMNYSRNQYKKLYVDGSENNHVENWLILRKSATTLFGRGSVIFNNKIEASFLYRPSVRFTKTVAYSMGTSNMQVQFYYLFREKK